MKSNRTTRSLAALAKTGSTNRVLNLLAVERDHGADPEYESAPMFRDRVLNRSVILKHRLRRDELYLFDDFRVSATKIIVPFSGADLKLGGRSVFIGQRNWAEMLQEVCGDNQDVARDLDLLERLDTLPSLDPFLLREHLRQHGYEVAQCYFAISAADLAKMQAFVGGQIRQLIELAYSKVGGATENYTAKLVDALLATEVDERLEPLRRTLMLEGEAYREGVFSWRGFLYYKWVLASVQPEMLKVVDEVAKLVISGPPDPETIKYIESARMRLQRAISEQLRDTAGVLAVYDHAYRQLTTRGDPQAFVDFLRQAPGLFVDLGERIGVISHIASFWRYRFPAGKPLRAPIHEAAEIFQDFEAGLATSLAA
jgi:hypothetical protein